MLASLFVFGVMVALILLSVFFFGDTVAEGPLQISMTLATLAALGVSYYYGYRTALISESITHHVGSALGTIFIILPIGCVITGLYLSGTVAAFVYYGAVFVLSSVLSVLTGSSSAIAAVGVAFVGLANLMGVDPAITAGAAVSGAFLGDKVAKISDTFVLTTAVVGNVSREEHARSVMRTALPAWLLSAILFFILGYTETPSGASVDPTEVQAVISGVFAISPLAFTPMLLIFVLSAIRLSGFITLMLSAVTAVILAAFTQRDLIIAVAGDPNLYYAGAVLKTGIEIFAQAFTSIAASSKWTAFSLAGVPPPCSRPSG